MKYRLKIIRFMRILALILIITCGIGRTAYAAADSASLDLNRIGSVSITLKDSDGNTLTDGTLTIYQVALLGLDGGNMTYAYTNAFSDCIQSLEADGTLLTDLLDTESSALADALAAYATGSGISGTSADISSDGTVSFDNLELGLYLVVQTVQSTGFHVISPFLVTVPYAEDDSWNYDVDASPKVETVTEIETTETEETTTEPEETTTEPEETTTTSEETTTASEETTTSSEETTTSGLTTDDDSSTPTILPQTGQLNWPIPVLAICGLVLFAVGWLMYVTDRRRKNHAA